MMNDFWLTQRLQRKTYKRDGDKGLDLDFSLDYMGSSEFEWGAIPKALREMRETCDLAIHETNIQMAGLERTVYFIADRQSYQAKREHWAVWIDGGMRGQERTHFAEVFAGDKSASGYYLRTVAWWAIDSDAAWTLDSEVAPLLLSGLRGNAAPMSKRQARKLARA